MTQKPNNKLKTLTDLESGDCRWPLGDPRQPGFHFCGEKKVADRPYCLAHWQMSFVPSKSRHSVAAPLPIKQLPIKEAA